MNFAAPYAAANPTPCPRYAKVSAPAGSSATLVNLYKFAGAYLRPGSEGPGVTAVQKALGVSPTGTFGPLTTAAVLKVKANYKLGSNPLMDAITWKVTLRWVAARQPAATPAPAAGGNPLAPYRNTTVKYDSRGPAVSALQRRLSVTPVSGWFGPNTRAAVQSWQRYRKLPATGVVDLKVWVALGA
jgi:peptidoglycan hydrolase-like protein with peptidoglycan-binding domain